MEAAKASPVQLLIQREKTASGDREEIAGIASRLDNLQVNEFLSFLPFPLPPPPSQLDCPSISWKK